MAASATNPDDLVEARLVAENAAVRPGDIAWVALHLTMKKGWHTYWRNPGDAGQKTEIAWTLPKGFAAGDIQWPVPRKFDAGIGASYGYTDETALLVPVQVPASAKPGAVELAAAVNWLVCEAICVPGEARLSLKLDVGPAAMSNAAAKALFDRARALLPGDIDAPVRAKASESGIVLALPEQALKGMAAPEATFMPFDDTLIDHAAPQRLQGSALALKRGQVQGKLPAETAGLLLVADTGTGAKRAFNLTVQIGGE